MTEIPGFRSSLQQAKQEYYQTGERMARLADRNDLVLTGSEKTAKIASDLLADVWRDSLLSGRLTEELDNELRRRSKLVYNSPAQRRAGVKTQELVGLIENA